MAAWVKDAEWRQVNPKCELFGYCIQTWLVGRLFFLVVMGTLLGEVLPGSTLLEDPSFLKAIGATTYFFIGITKPTNQPPLHQYGAWMIRAKRLLLIDKTSLFLLNKLPIKR
ncbi:MULTISPECIES: hypothetical protein [Pseudomonas putida group]|uniref:hypothetical protein n=1 Tax=Pseudomonas putida group TaxID=136845 RepID=UPI0018AA3B3A|nr:hypothetical protein [Pseudomonas monteilii]MBF8746406.1 hypothetical protein [Pseudomonas monteilii]